jgi:WD40 repeat protein
MQAPPKVRKRGVVLTEAGLQKLNAARRQAEIQDNQGERFTLEGLCDRTQLSLKTITKVLDAKGTVDRQTLEAFFCAFNLTLEKADFQHPLTLSAIAPHPIDPSIPPTSQTDWGEAPDVSSFYGRHSELEQLQQWVQRDRCRLIGILGMGGMGKTALVTKLARRLADDEPKSEAETLRLSPNGCLPTPFQSMIWRSLRNAPSRDTVVSDWLSVLSGRTETQPDLARVVHYLKTQRCLLVLDNFETILNRGRAGDYRPGYEDYGELLRLLGSTQHQSCLLLTSREKVLELVPLEGEALPVRCLTLQGCNETARQLIRVRGLRGTPEQQQALCDRYSSSPLAIQIIAATIRDLFDGDIGTFLQQDALLFNGLRRLLDQQFERLSPLEQAIMFWLAINREWTALEELKQDLLLPVTSHQVLEAVESLHWRSLIEKQSGSYTQQPVVMEYITERLTEQVSAEIVAIRHQLLPLNPFLRCYALLKTTAKDYVRITQSRLILEPICNLLQTTLLSRRVVVEHLKAAIAQYQAAVGIQLDAMPHESDFEVDPSYAAGNLLNLLCHLGADLSGLNLSGLAVWQAYLPNVPLPHTNFARADLWRSQLTDTFGAIFAAVFSPDGDRFVTGELGGYLRCWRVSDGQAAWIVKACNTRIYSLAFSPDGTTLAIGSGDHTVEFWDAATGHHLRSLSGHCDQICSIDFHPTGKLLASASCDATIRLWDIDTGACVHVFEDLPPSGHANQIYCLRFSPEGNVLISGSSDRTLKVWDAKARQLRQTLVGHDGHVLSVAVHPQGHLLASGSADGTVKLWCLERGILLHTWSGHTAHVLSVRFSPDGALLASGDSDATICLWDSQTGHLVNTLHHSHWVRAVAFSPDGRTLLSGCSGYSLKLWDVGTGHLLRTWSGYSNWIWTTAWSQDGTKLVSGGGDRTVRIWDARTGECLQTLRGYTSWVLAATCNPDCSLVANSGGDNSIVLWNANSGQALKTLTGHTSQVFCLRFSPTEGILASSSSDYSVRLWDVLSGQPLRIMQGHQDWVRSIAFSPDGKLLVSVGQDLVMNLWDVRTGGCLRTWRNFDAWVWSVSFHPDGKRVVTASRNQLTLWDIRANSPLKTYEGHTKQIRSVVISPDGCWLASGGQDNLIHLWDIDTGKILQTFSGHTEQVMSVNFSPDGRYLLSGSADETIRIWDIKTGQLGQTLRAEGLYEGMNIAGVRGLNEDAIATLKQLGARAGEQGSRGAGEQGSRGAGERGR